MQDEVVLCTATPQQVIPYAREAEPNGADRGRITDLTTLLREEPDELVSPMGLGAVVLVGMFAVLWVWKRRSVSIPAAVGFYVGMIVAAIVG